MWRAAISRGRVDQGPIRFLRECCQASLKRVAQRPFRETPLGRQWAAVADRFPEFLVLFQVGDFYEFYGEHARVASSVLGIALTRKNSSQTEPIEMSGVPVFALPHHLARLIKAGHRLALCDQVKPDQDIESTRVSKLVPREVTRLVTPGTLLEEELLDPKSNNFLLSVSTSQDQQQFGLAWLDLSTGDFGCDRADSQVEVRDAFARLNPAEVLINPRSRISHLFPSLTCQSLCISTFAEGDQDGSNAEVHNLETLLCLVTEHDLDSLAAQTGNLSDLEKTSCELLLRYVAWTQCGRKLRLSPPRRFQATATMSIDASTRHALELTRTIRDGGRRGSLLWAIDGTVTCLGGRLLESYLRAPSFEVVEITRRLDLVDWFFRDMDAIRVSNQILRQVQDMDRALSRIGLLRGNPSDLRVIGHSLKLAHQLKESLKEFCKYHRPNIAVEQLLQSLANADDSVGGRIRSALTSADQAVGHSPGFIKAGFCLHLDARRGIMRESRKAMEDLTSKYSVDASLTSLKLQHAQSLGFVLGVSLRERSKAERLEHFRMIPGGSLKNVIRFRTDELVALDAKHREATALVDQREREIFEELCRAITEKAGSIRVVAKALAEVDVAAGLAKIATERQFVRPLVLPAGGKPQWSVIQGRHPAVERYSDLTQGPTFVPNDCVMIEDSVGDGMKSGGLCWVISGPNMGGKSTFLRQNAVIAILAHIGSFVPSEMCTITAVDRIFSRVGASDEIARSKSTFMVEMEECARFLNSASRHSLVVVDELGRGTSQREGLALSIATLEYLTSFVRCRCLFATHFGSSLTQRIRGAHLVSFHHIRAKVLNHRRGVQFLYRVEHGPGPDESLGIEVASMANVPEWVIERARWICQETNNARKEIGHASESQIHLLLRTTLLDTLSSDEAIRLLRTLRSLLPPD